ncbi:MAG: 50S ribosome-binding GTPase [Candidatus Heimdallarchaeota archaeon]|nr:50S ribosome-binding GTPase [Candidatus Heimdallarchaeota archaeon]
MITHNDHLRIIYFETSGIYLGDTISLNLNQNRSTVLKNPIPILPKFKSNRVYSIQKAMLKLIWKSHSKITIVGPSFAGKTSLTLYLETGIPERYTRRINHAATLGRSVKRLKLGRSHLTVYDMGGQKDFWERWSDPISESDRLVFVVDGSANNIREMADAMNLVLDSRDENTPILIIVNKMDLFLEGFLDNFNRVEEFVSLLDRSDFQKVWFIEASIYNGICYNYNDMEELPLSQVIYEFIQFKENTT